MLGSASWIVTDGTQDLVSYLLIIGSVVLFGVYATVLPIPLVLVYEKVIY
jgi:hypothetical protein